MLPGRPARSERLVYALVCSLNLCERGAAIFGPRVMMCIDCRQSRFWFRFTAFSQSPALIHLTITTRTCVTDRTAHRTTRPIGAPWAPSTPKLSLTRQPHGPRHALFPGAAHPPSPPRWPAHAPPPRTRAPPKPAPCTASRAAQPIVISTTNKSYPPNRTISHLAEIWAG